MLRRNSVLLKSRSAVVTVLSRRSKDTIPDLESLDVRPNSNNNASEVSTVESGQSWESKSVICRLPVPAVQTVSEGPRRANKGCSHRIEADRLDSNEHLVRSLKRGKGEVVNELVTLFGSS